MQWVVSKYIFKQALKEGGYAVFHPWVCQSVTHQWSWHQASSENTILFDAFVILDSNFLVIYILTFTCMGHWTFFLSHSSQELQSRAFWKFVSCIMLACFLWYFSTSNVHQLSVYWFCIIEFISGPTNLLWYFETATQQYNKLKGHVEVSTQSTDLYTVCLFIALSNCWDRIMNLWHS